MIMINDLLMLLGNYEVNLNKLSPITKQKDDKAYYINTVLVGYKKEDIDIQIINDMLIIKAKGNDTYDIGTYFEPIDFERKFTMPNDSNPDDITATYESGILKIRIGKKEEVKYTKKVVIK